MADLRAASVNAHYPGDPAYERLSESRNVAVRHRAAVVVVPDEPADVAAAVAVAVRHGLPVLVQATGHGATIPLLGGMLIVTSELRQLTVDAAQRTVTAGAGVLWSELADACAAVGLAAGGMASVGSVGVVGYTLGGGIGPMARTFGFAADHVTAIDVITSDGPVRTVTPDDDGELFWALLGGKYGLGVVTALTMSLIPAPQLLSAVLTFASAEIAPAFTAFARWTATLDRSITAVAMMMRMPDIDQVPEPLRGQLALTVTVVVVDAPDTDRDALVAALSDGATPIATATGVTDPAGWLNAQQEPPPMPVYQQGRLSAEFTSETVEALLGVVGPGLEVPILGVEIRPMGGSLADPAPNAVGGRDGGYLINALGAPRPELFETEIPALFDRLFGALEPWLQRGSQVNFHGHGNDRHRLADCWPSDVYARIGAIRRSVDPAAVFVVPQPLTVPPGGAIGNHRDSGTAAHTSPLGKV